VFVALVTEGLVRIATHIAETAETDDPVADHVTKGWAYYDWALAHPQLYRLMFGLTGADLRLRAKLEIRTEAMAHFPEGRAALQVMVGSVRRIIESQRIRPVDPLLVARLSFSATDGHAPLHIAGTFGNHDEALLVLGALALNLMIGLGDEPDAVERSMLATRTDPP
jgi:hypothetical protein